MSDKKDEKQATADNQELVEEQLRNVSGGGAPSLSDQAFNPQPEPPPAANPFRSRLRWR